VLRKPGSYVPPGARKSSAPASTVASTDSQSTTPNATADGSNVATKPEPPKVAVNGPDETPSPVPAANKVCSTDYGNIQGV